MAPAGFRPSDPDHTCIRQSGNDTESRILPRLSRLVCTRHRHLVDLTPCLTPDHIDYESFLSSPGGFYHLQFCPRSHGSSYRAPLSANHASHCRKDLLEAFQVPPCFGTMWRRDLGQASREILFRSMLPQLPSAGQRDKLVPPSCYGTWVGMDPFRSHR